MWSLATPCMLCIFIGTGILGGKFYEGARLKDLRSTRYATLIERKIAESEAVNGQQSPVRLVQFRPAAIDRLHRIILIFKNSYEISQTSESKKWGTIDVWTGPNSGFLYPNAELRLIAATGSVLKSTNRVDQEYLMTMKLEFTPHDLDDYSVEFIGPPKGFAEYRIVIEAQGIE